MEIENDPVLMGHLYYQMLRIRLVEEKIAELYPEQEMRCPVHLCIGQEAVPAGVCAAISTKDYVMSAHRSHGHFLAKGGDLRAMMAEFYGKRKGCTGGRGGSMHLTDEACGFIGAVPIVAASIPIAVGAAFGSVMKGEDRVTAVFFGDAATEEGVFYESISFAVLRHLPVIFVCENNLYSVYSPLCVRQPEGREIWRMAAAHGVEATKGDGNNVIEVYRLSKKAVKKAREGGGPTLLEFKTYRWMEHCGPNADNHLGYRSLEESQEWLKRCPVEAMARYLLEKGLCSREELEKTASEIQDEIEEAVAFAKRGSFPERASLLKGVYASPSSSGKGSE